jgi:small ligand-binding sensory domain FIST
MASAAHVPGGNRLFLDGAELEDGAVGVGLGGSLRVDTVVSQGCRPVGQPMVVTRVDDGAIAQLGRRQAYEVAHEMLTALPEDEQALIRKGLFLGVVINEYRTEFTRGDFLVRGVLGVKPETGALAVGAAVRPGQTVQFHVRDAATAHEDLSDLLRPQGELGDAAGALLFSCNGRGVRMFDQPHHDASALNDALSGAPVAGFFAMGELGPIGGKSFIHGHTASVAVFRPEAE